MGITPHCTERDEMPIDAIRSAPDIQEIKCLFNDILAHGTREKVANVLGVTRKDVSNRFTLDHERKPALYEGLREVWSVCLVSPEAGRKLRAYIDGLFDYWLDPPVATGKNITTIIGEAGEEMATLSREHLEERPVRDRRDQALAVRALIDEYIAVLEQQFELRAETRFSSKRAG